METKTKKPIGVECKFAIHIPSRNHHIPDVHMVKERIHYDDGTTAPNVKFIKDFKRPIYITKPAKRNHQQKKEWEHIDNLLVKEVTQSRLRDELAKMLDKSWSKEQLNVLSASPYVYGVDVSSTTLIKQKYLTQYPELKSGYSVAAFDIETDVVDGTEDVIMASIIFKDKAYIAVKKQFLSGLSMVEDRFQKALDKYIGDHLKEANMTVELYIAEDTVDAIRATFMKAHEWQPDFLAIWNMDFDIPQILANLEKHNVDPKSILCDPKVPEALRICKYKPGPAVKVTASGKAKPLNPAIRWHTLELTASFYVIDAMCTYKHLRLSKQEEPSYSLDYILGKELKLSKLKFSEADGLKYKKWHEFMQKNYKIEYMVYNIFDSLAMLKLDAKTKDLSHSLASFSAASDFNSFKSQPKRITDALFFFCLEKEYVLASTGREIQNEVEIVDDEDLDDDDEDSDTFMDKAETLNLRDWINKFSIFTIHVNLMS